MKIISTTQAPAAIWPYAQAVVHNGLVYTSGQIALDPQTMEIVWDDIISQTQQVVMNLDAVIQEAWASPQSVIKCTVFLSDMENFSAVNEIYAWFFWKHTPARSTVEVARLPKDVLVEIECIAIVAG
jgi:2-iminobutanoate/2-iminopropanoate deaminase